MIVSSLRELFRRDLNRLQKELESYREEKNLWLVEKEISNSAGNLFLHLFGNLQYYFGAVLNNSGYARNREKEFADKNVSRKEMLKLLEIARQTVDQTLEKLTDADLEKIYPVNVFGEEMTTSHFMIHLYGHFNYHLGQINYHRRLIED